MFGFFSLLIAIVAFVVARKAFNQAAMLRARLDAIEAAGLQATPGPPPLTPREAFGQTQAPSSPGVAPAQPAAVGDARQIAPVAEGHTARPTRPPGRATAPPPPLPQPGPSL